MLTRKFHIIQPVVVKKNSPVAGAQVHGEKLQSSAARAGCRRARARSPSAGRWCRRRTAPTAGGRTAPARTRTSRAGTGRTTDDSSHAVPRRRRDRGPGRARPARSARQPGDELGDLGAAGRSPCRRSGSRRRRRGPPARAGRTGPARRGHRSRARTLAQTAPRLAVASIATMASRRRWAGRRPPGRPADPAGAKVRGDGADLAGELLPRQLAQRVRLVGEQQRRLARSLAGRSMCSAKFSRAPGNQRAPGMSRLSRTAVCGAETDAEEVPDGLPELLQLGGRPCPELGVVGEPAAGARLGETGELGEPGPCDAFGGRRPEQVALPHRGAGLGALRYGNRHGENSGAAHV